MIDKLFTSHSQGTLGLETARRSPGLGGDLYTYVLIREQHGSTNRHRLFIFTHGRACGGHIWEQSFYWVVNDPFLLLTLRYVGSALTDAHPRPAPFLHFFELVDSLLSYSLFANTV